MGSEMKARRALAVKHKQQLVELVKALEIQIDFDSPAEVEAFALLDTADVTAAQCARYLGVAGSGVLIINSKVRRMEEAVRFALMMTSDAAMMPRVFEYAKLVRKSPGKLLVIDSKGVSGFTLSSIVA